jgi:hypothetical protein
MRRRRDHDRVLAMCDTGGEIRTDDPDELVIGIVELHDVILRRHLER